MKNELGCCAVVKDILPLAAAIEWYDVWLVVPAWGKQRLCNMRSRTVDKLLKLGLMLSHWPAIIQNYKPLQFALVSKGCKIYNSINVIHSVMKKKKKNTRNQHADIIHHDLITYRTTPGTIFRSPWPSPPFLDPRPLPLRPTVRVPSLSTLPRRPHRSLPPRLAVQQSCSRLFLLQNPVAGIREEKLCVGEKDKGRWSALGGRQVDT